MTQWCPLSPPICPSHSLTAHPLRQQSPSVPHQAHFPSFRPQLVQQPLPIFFNFSKIIISVVFIFFTSNLSWCNFNICIPRVSSGNGFELYFWRVPVPASYSNSQQATGIPRNLNSKPFSQADETRGMLIHWDNYDIIILDWKCSIRKSTTDHERPFSYYQELLFFKGLTDAFG